MKRLVLSLNFRTNNMENSVKYSVQFYQNLGKLFYAIAAADKKVRDEEYNRLKEIVRTDWLTIDDLDDDLQTDAAHQIEVVFDWLNVEEKLDATTWFDEFIHFRKEHPQLFNKPINDLILKTAHSIAASFSGKNKSELIMLARLGIHLKE